MNLLIVDDEKGIRDVIREYANLEKYNIYEADDGIKAIEMVKSKDIDLVVLDIMMPHLDGLSAYKEFKKFKNVPTIILSARGEEYDKLMGFDLGADDYLTKPFSPKELMARIKAVLKRYKNEIDKFTYKTLEVDFLGYTISIDDKTISVTPKEYELLTYLIKNKNVAVTREQLLSAIWGYDFFGDDRTIDTHIKMLRNSLKEYRDLVTTVRGIGYKFEIPKE